MNSTTKNKTDPPSSYPDNETGDATIQVLKNAERIASKMTGNNDESLGLHPAIYFTNDKGTGALL